MNSGRERKEARSSDSEMPASQKIDLTFVQIQSYFSILHLLSKTDAQHQFACKILDF